jgi:hypothetical protein
MQRVGRVDPHRTRHPRRRPSPCTIFPWVPRPPRRSAAARILHGGTNAAVNRPRTEGRPEQRRRGVTSRGVALTGCRRAVKRKGAAPHGSAGHLAPAKARGPPHRAGVLFGWKGPPAWRHGQEAETRLDSVSNLKGGQVERQGQNAVRSSEVVSEVSHLLYIEWCMRALLF